MKGMHNFQYEIGKTYAIEEQPIMCERGFHFCGKLRDVFHYYSIFGGESRFFKVRALVKKADVDFAGKVAPGWLNYFSKNVAKKIEIVSEISSEELLECAKSVYKCVDSIEDLKYSSYKEMMRSKIQNMLLSQNFTDTFIRIYTDSYLCGSNLNTYEDICFRILLILNSGASHDLMVYELMNIKYKQEVVYN